MWSSIWYHIRIAINRGCAQVEKGKIYIFLLYFRPDQSQSVIILAIIHAMRTDTGSNTIVSKKQMFSPGPETL